MLKYKSCSCIDIYQLSFNVKVKIIFILKSIQLLKLNKQLTAIEHLYKSKRLHITEFIVKIIICFHIFKPMFRDLVLKIKQKSYV